MLYKLRGWLPWVPKQWAPRF